MNDNVKVAVILGSLRRESLSRQLAKALAALAPRGLELEIVEIGELPLYNEDLEKEGAPESWLAFRRRIRAADALLFITPEYNRSVPAPLKNAIDVGSRPYGQAAFGGKPAAVVSLSQGAMGGFGANHHLRQSLVFLDVPTMQQPEAYLGNAAALFEADGKLKEGPAREFLARFMAAFGNWTGRAPIKAAA